MTYFVRTVLLLLTVTLAIQAVPALAAEQYKQAAQLRAGGYFPANKDFEVGTGFDLSYTLKVSPYLSLESAAGYYRADKENSHSVFLSAIPLTVSALAILPLPSVNLHAGGGVGAYFTMVSGFAGDPQLSSDLPPDLSEMNFGYHGTAGIEFLTAGGLSMLVDYTYASVNQGKFAKYDIKHGGSFVYGGFALNF